MHQRQIPHLYCIFSQLKVLQIEIGTTHAKRTMTPGCNRRDAASEPV